MQLLKYQQRLQVNCLVKLCDGLSGLNQLCTHYTVPVWLTAAPTLAILKAVSNAGLTASQVDYYEITE